jgi:imidazolonepropionase-like amidohydrolase
LAKKYKIKTAWGTDVLFSRALAQQQGAILASLIRWYSPDEALAMATSTNAELWRCPASAIPIRENSASGAGVTPQEIAP